MTRPIPLDPARAFDIFPPPLEVEPFGVRVDMSSPTAALASPSGATGKPAEESDPPRDGALLLPVFLKLAGRKVLVVGAGPVAAAKIAGLRGTGARIVVVAPQLSPALRAEVEQGASGITVAERGFSPADLDGAWLVIAAAPPEINRAVAAAAEAGGRCLFVIAVDDPDAASAYGGGTLRRGGVTVAISTDGQAPALAGLLREGLEAVIPSELDTWVAEARALRPGWRADGVPLSRRRPLLLEALNRLYRGGA
jgi:uroporphyrin-III C-methyltransferase/precorrin-2 dehydrogenase/sirohydrochlorin ferrochelatase